MLYDSSALQIISIGLTVLCLVLIYLVLFKLPRH